MNYVIDTPNYFSNIKLSFLDTLNWFLQR